MRLVQDAREGHEGRPIGHPGQPRAAAAALATTVATAKATIGKRRSRRRLGADICGEHAGRASVRTPSLQGRWMGPGPPGPTTGSAWKPQEDYFVLKLVVSSMSPQRIESSPPSPSFSNVIVTCSAAGPSFSTFKGILAKSFEGS